MLRVVVFIGMKFAYAICELKSFYFLLGDWRPCARWESEAKNRHRATPPLFRDTLSKMILKFFSLFALGFSIPTENKSGMTFNFKVFLLNDHLSLRLQRKCEIGRNWRISFGYARKHSRQWKYVSLF